MSLTPNQSSDIHVTLHTDTLIKELSIFGHVMDSSPSPSQSTWSSKLVAKVNEVYGVKVETMISKGERYPHSAKSLLCDTVYYNVYSNISSNISCLRIEHYKQMRILNYSQSRAVSGILANL